MNRKSSRLHAFMRSRKLLMLMHGSLARAPMGDCPARERVERLTRPTDAAHASYTSTTSWQQPPPRLPLASHMPNPTATACGERGSVVALPMTRTSDAAATPWHIAEERRERVCRSARSVGELDQIGRRGSSATRAGAAGGPRPRTPCAWTLLPWKVSAGLSTCSYPARCPSNA